MIVIDINHTNAVKHPKLEEDSKESNEHQCLGLAKFIRPMSPSQFNDWSELKQQNVKMKSLVEHENEQDSWD